MRFDDGRAETVRLIGVDTPETVHPGREIECFGEEASTYTTRRLLGETISIALDQEERDRYGRLLAYLWLDDGEFFNQTLLAEGYAIERHYPPNTRYQSLLQQAERDARANDHGLWSACLAVR